MRIKDGMIWVAYYLLLGVSSFSVLMQLDLAGVTSPAVWWVGGYALAIFHVVCIVGFSARMRGDSAWQALRNFKL